MCSTTDPAEWHILYQVVLASLKQMLPYIWLIFFLGLVAPVRAVAFSPGGKLLAAAGDSNIIMLYETSSGEQVAHLTGHSAWVMSLDWNSTGEYLLSG